MDISAILVVEVRPFGKKSPSEDPRRLNMRFDKSWPVAAETSFEELDDGYNRMKIAHPEPSAVS